MVEPLYNRHFGTKNFSYNNIYRGGFPLSGVKCMEASLLEKSLILNTENLLREVPLYQDTWSCVSSQERHATRASVVYWHHKVTDFSPLYL